MNTERNSVNGTINRVTNDVATTKEDEEIHSKDEDDKKICEACDGLKDATQKAKCGEFCKKRENKVPCGYCTKIPTFNYWHLCVYYTTMFWNECEKKEYTTCESKLKPTKEKHHDKEYLGCQYNKKDQVDGYSSD